MIAPGSHSPYKEGFRDEGEGYGEAEGKEEAGHQRKGCQRDNSDTRRGCSYSSYLVMDAGCEEHKTRRTKVGTGFLFARRAEGKRGSTIEMEVAAER